MPKDTEVASSTDLGYDERSHVGVALVGKGGPACTVERGRLVLSNVLGICPHPNDRARPDATLL